MSEFLEQRSRHGCVSAWLWLALVATTLSAVAAIFCTYDDGVELIYGLYTRELDYCTSYAIAMGVSGLCSIVSLLGILLMLQWNKFGFYLCAIASIVGAIVTVLTGGSPIILVSSLVAIFIWWAILQISSDGTSAWNNMETDTSIAPHKNLYLIMSVVFVIALAVAAFGISRSPKKPAGDPLLQTETPSYYDSSYGEPAEEVAEPVEVEETAEY